MSSAKKTYQRTVCALDNQICAEIDGMECENCPIFRRMKDTMEETGKMQANLQGKLSRK